MSLIAEPTTGNAFSFGWRNLGAGLLEQRWICVATYLVCVAYAVLCAASGKLQLQSGIENVAVFAALAFSVRLAVPTAKMTATFVLKIFGVYCAFFGAALLVILGLLALIAVRAYLPAFIAGLVSAVLCIWLSTKLWLFSALYVINGGRIGVWEAVAESWRLVEGSMWWTVFGLCLSIALVCALPAAIVATSLYSALAASSTINAGVVAGGAYYLFTVPMVFWAQTSVTALATALAPMPSELEMETAQERLPNAPTP